MEESKTFIKLRPQELGTAPQQCTVFEQLASELKTITEKTPILKELIARGGFILDTIMGAEPNDIDLFYALKQWTTPQWHGCKCDEIKQAIASLKLPVTSKRKVDTGHILEGEMYLDPIPKILGYFSHHIEIPSKVLLDADGYIWTVKEAVTCITERIYELRNTGRVQHAYYPYADDPGYRDYVTNTARLVVRGLRMIHTKQYRSVGQDFFDLVDNSSLVWKTVLANKDFTQILKRNMTVKNGFMTLADYANALAVTHVSNQGEILESIKRILESE